MISVIPDACIIFVHAIPAAPRPSRYSEALDRLADDLERIEERRHHDHRGPVLVVMEDRDVELLLEAVLDLEAARRRDVLEVDPAKVGASSFTVWMIPSGSLVARQIGKASTPANSLNSIALPSITGIAASGPMSPRPSTAEPSETTATVFALIVKSNAFDLSAAMYSQTLATPGV